MLLASGCGRRVGAGFPGYALVATAGENNISIVDLDRFRLVKQLAVGGPPCCVVSGPRAAYVLTSRTGSVHAVAPGFEQVVSRRLADHLSGLQLSPDNRHLLAIAGPSRELIEADASSLAVTRRWKLDVQPVALDVSPQGVVAMASGEHGALELVDTRTGQHSRVQFQGTLGQVRFRSDGKLLMVANRNSQTLTALQIPSLQVIVELPVAMQPDNLCFKTDGGELYVSGRGMDGIAIASPYLPLEIEQTVLGGRDPGTMACTFDSAYLFIASASGSDVSILTTDRRRMVGIVEVGQKPSFIAITPDDQYALVLNEASGDMAVIRIPTIQQKMGDAAKMRGKAGASLFTMLPVGSRPVHAAIVRKT